MKKILLASASPRRKELLDLIGLKFQVEPSGVSEPVRTDLDPHELARSISMAKAAAVAKSHDNTIVIAADTFGVLEGRILGKPATAGEARQMLTTISGKAHSVITGFTIMDTSDSKVVCRSVETRVYIRRLSTEEVEAYVRSGEPLDKAGAYAIQGLGSVIVERIEGDYFNVIGLPLCALAESLREFGIRVL